MDDTVGRSQRDPNILMRELEASRMIHGQIAKLNSAVDLKNAINEVLAYVGAQLGAERAYIFENKGEFYCNTYEWCNEGVRAEIDTLQEVPFSEMIHWTDVLDKGDCVVIPDIEAIKETQSFIYETLSRQNIHSVVEAPIAIDGKLIGFIGVDNAPKDVTSLISESLTVLGTFIGTVIRNEKEREKLRQSNADIKDAKGMQDEIVGAIGCGVLAYTVPEYKVLTINREARRIIGCAEDDQPVKAFFRFLNERVVPEDRDLFRNSKVKMPGDVQHDLCRVDHGNGIISVKSSIRMLRFANGQKYILCSMLDITEQVTLANSLSAERKSYREALENGSEFTFFFDVNEGLIHDEFLTAHNVNIIRKLGLKIPVSVDVLLSKYIEVSDIQFANEDMYKNFTCKGLLEAFSKGITNVVSEFYDPNNDLYIRTSCLMSLNDATGHVNATVVASDITDLRKAEQTQRDYLKAANEKLEQVNDEINVRIDAILNGISGGLKIIDIDDDFRYTYISEGAAQLQGYTVEEFLQKFGRRVTSNIFEEDGEAALAEANRQIAEKGVYFVKYRVPHKDGGIRWVIDSGKLVKDTVTGKNLYYILMQDITELQDRNAELSHVLSMQQSMADSLGSGILAYTIPERKVLLLNQETRRMFSYYDTDSNTCGLDIMHRIMPEDYHVVSNAVKDLANPGDRAEYIFHSLNNSGVNAYKCSTKLLEFENGQQYILSSLNDITEQELMEKRLDEERRQYRNALTFGSHAFFSIDMSIGIINSHVYSKDGENITEALGLQVPATYDALAKAWFDEGRIVTWSRELDIIRSSKSVIEYCNKGNSIFDFEYHIPSSGRYYHVMALLDNIGGLPRISFIIYDITSSRQEEQQRRSIIESLGKIYSGLYHFSLDKRVYTAMKQYEDIAIELQPAGDLDDFIRYYIDKFIFPGDKPKLKEFLDPDSIRERLTGVDYDTIEYRRRGIGWCRLNLITAGRDENGVPVSVVFAGTVIEAQKQAELAAQAALEEAYEAANVANSAKTDFLANMSHDIRTPMNAIIGMTAIAGTHLDDRERVADCLSKITVSSKHLLGIINEVLDMSKIESGKMDLQEEEFNLPELIDNLLTMSKPDINAKGHELMVSIRNIEHERVIGDSQRIQQVFMNIISNAIKYTPPGGKIHLYVSEKPTNKFKIGCYEFIFEDNGYGISKEFMEHIFEPFSRARDDIRIDKIQGTGLGMPITKNIVQMMNGDIKVESELNKGTKVTITFFLKLKGSEDEVDYKKFIDLNVLVADDDETSCIYACEMLDELGMKSEWVLTGQEAVERTVKRHEDNNDFFAVILDWKMPGMDGVETTRQIRRHVGRDVPIIIISSFDWTDIELEARAAGANAFISKPLFKSRMVHMFNELVNGEDKQEKISDLDNLAKEDFSGRRALIVEDNEINAEIAGEILRMAGLEVSFAVNGKEAVDIMSSVEDNYFSIVFMDIQMPIMNGYEATRAIRAMPRSYLKSVPIIAMTANAFAEDVAAAKNAGMNEHIAKPLDFNQLLKALKKWLN